MKWTATLALLATAAFFHEYLPPFKRVHFFSDIEVYHFPLQRFAFESLKEGRIPQWDPSMYCGIPFAANVQAALFYPPTWLLYAANWRHAKLPFQSLEYFAVAHVWLAFVLCFAWLRGRRLDPFACALGAASFACGGYMMWQIVHLGVAAALPWMPLAFWGIDEAVERRRWHPLWKTAVASAMWFLAGYPPSWVAFCGTVVVYALASRAHWKAAVGAVLAIAASMLLAMVQVLPAMEAQSLIFKEPRYFGDFWSNIPSLFFANWNDYNRTSPMHYLAVRYLYWGVPMLFALVWAICERRLRPYVQPLAVMAFCLYFVGDPGSHIHEAIRWSMTLLGTFQHYNFFEGIAAMAALITATSVSAFLDSKSRRAAPRWLMPVVVLAVAGWCFHQLKIWAAGGVFITGSGAIAETAAALVILGLALWTMRVASGRARACIGAAIVVLVLCDYKVYGTNRLFNTRDGEVDPLYPAHGFRGISAPAFQAMSADRSYRVTSDGSPSSMEFRMIGLSSPQGLDPLLTRRYREFIQPWATFQTSRVFLVDYRNQAMLRDLGVRYAITHQGGPSADFLAASTDFRPVGPDSFYRVYEYLHARPAYAFEGEGDARLAAWLPERRAFQVHSAAGGRFGLVEQGFLGWRATVDGREVAIDAWRGPFQSIRVGPGDHVVTFEFHSRLLPWGAAVSIGSLAGLLWVIVAGGRRGTGFTSEST